MFVSFKQSCIRYAVMGDSLYLVQATLSYYLLQLKCRTNSSVIWSRSTYLQIYFSIPDLFAEDFSFSGLASRLVKLILFANRLFAVEFLLNFTLIWWTPNLRITTLIVIFCVGTQVNFLKQRGLQKFVCLRKDCLTLCICTKSA